MTHVVRWINQADDFKIKYTTKVEIVPTEFDTE